MDLVFSLELKGKNKEIMVYTKGKSELIRKAKKEWEDGCLKKYRIYFYMIKIKAKL